MQGKSLAQILSVILYISRIIIVILLVVMGIAFVALLGAGIFEGSFRAVPGVNLKLGEDSVLPELLEVMAAGIGFWIAFDVVSRLIEILNSISRGTPFESDNAGRLSRIAKVLVFGVIASIVLTIAGEIFSREGAGIDVNLGWLLAAGVSAVLAEVFREGARLREEQEYTV